MVFEVVVRMEYLVPSLRIVEFIDMDDIGVVRGRLAQLVELEEDRFIAGFHQQVRRNERRPIMTSTSIRRHSIRVI
jgi:hypothetical protein